MDRTNILLIIGLLCVKGEIIANSKSCGFFIDKEDIFVSAKIHKDTLAEDSINTMHQLQEVIVSSNYSIHKDGIVTYNVATLPNIDKIQTNKLLTLIPGVSKNGEGNYEYLGKPIVFYLNGVRQNLDTKAITALFSSLPASAISNIKVIEVNNGKYRDDGNQVVDIKTKSNISDGSILQGGLSGSFFRHGMGDWGPNVFYMFKKGKWIFYNTASYMSNSNYSFSTDSTQYGTTGYNISHRIKSGGHYNALSYNSKLTYTFRDCNQLDFSTYIYYDFGHLYHRISQNQQRSSVLESSDEYYRYFSNDDLWSGALAYIIPDDKKAFHGTVSLNVMYGGLRTSNKYYEIPAENYYQRSRLKMTGWMNSVLADFGSNFNKFRLMYGWHMQWNWMNDHANYDDTYNNPTSRSWFYGRELITTEYAAAYYDINKHLTLGSGTRVETTNYKLSYKSDGYQTHKDFTDINPYIMFFYNSKNYNLSLVAWKSTARPSYLRMTPGKRKVTDDYYTEGNADLTRTKNYSVNLYNTLFNLININFRYVYYKGAIGQIYQQKNEILYQRSLNFADIENYNLGLSLPIALFHKKLYGQLSANCTYVNFKKFRNGYIPPKGRPTYSWQQGYTLSLGYDATDRLSFDAYADFTPKRKSLFYTSYAKSYAEIGASYQLLSDKSLTVGVEANNIFDSNGNKQDFYFGDNTRRDYVHSKGPSFNFYIRLRLKKGKDVSNEYKEYSPDIKRMTKE